MNEGRFANNGCFGALFAAVLSAPFWVIVAIVAFRVF